MAAKALPEQSALLQLLRYDPETGHLFWKERPLEGFATVRAGRTWNSRFAGKLASVGVHPTSGYIYIQIEGARFMAHRVIWKMMTDVDPEQVDHINGFRTDNRWSNLRDVTRIVNCQNARLSKNNQSGALGVMFHKASNKWLAKIGVGMKIVHLGVFDQFDDAAAARKAAEIEYGFHENHGRAA